jgi:hypothetical protein
VLRDLALAAQIALIPLIFLASGCGENDATVELGTGTVNFEPLEDGDELVVVAGPQGGYHFVVHARATGLAAGDPTMPGIPANPRTRFSAILDGEEVDMEQSPYRLGYEQEGDFQVLPSGRILRLLDEIVPAIHGREVVLTVTVEDSEGDTASDERLILAVPDPDPP